MIPQHLSVPIKKEGRLAFHSQPSSDGLSSVASSSAAWRSPLPARTLHGSQTNVAMSEEAGKTKKNRKPGWADIKKHISDFQREGRARVEGAGSGGGCN